MLIFDIITIFPEIFDSYLKESIIKRAQEKRLIKINVRNLRKWTTDRHKTVDDKPYGGGLGMVLKVGPIYKAISSLTKCKMQNAKISLKSYRSSLASAKLRQMTNQNSKFYILHYHFAL